MKDIKRSACIALATMACIACIDLRVLRTECGCAESDFELSANDVIELVFDRCMEYDCGAAPYGFGSAVFYSGVLNAYYATGNAEYYEYVRLHTPDRDWTDTAAIDIEDAAMLRIYGALYNDDTSATLVEGISSQLKGYMTSGLYDYSFADNLYALGWINGYASERTDDDAYVHADNQSYRKRRAILFDFDEGLWYEDKNKARGGADSLTVYGDKIFDAVSNALIYMSLADRLGFSVNAEYGEYHYDFVAMSESFMSCQRADGFWNKKTANASDAEKSDGVATAGILYGISAGIENGILNAKKYRSTANRAYSAVLSAINTDFVTDFDWGILLSGLSAYLRLMNNGEFV